MFETKMNSPLDPSMERRARAHVTKIFNFPVSLAERLREEALRRSQEAGFRVTEKEIVIEALNRLLSNSDSFTGPGY